MLDGRHVVRELHAASDARVAKRRMNQLRPLRGLRGVAPGEIARIAAGAWKRGIDLDRDAAALAELFGGAHEDGLVAMGLCAAGAAQYPDIALDLAEEWLAQVDDLESADALGWIVLGAATSGDSSLIDWALDLSKDDLPVRRRVGVAAGLAMTFERIEGPAAAPLRERLGARHVAIGQDCTRIAHVADAYLQDDSPHVQRAVARLLRAWSQRDSTAASQWAERQPGGIRKAQRLAIEKGARKAERNPQTNTVVCAARTR